MAMHYPIVFEREDSGVYSAYVAGLPVYAQGSTRVKAASAIVRTLSAYLDAHPQEQPRAEVRVAKVSIPTRGRARWKPHESTQGGEFPYEWSLGREAAEGARRVARNSDCARNPFWRDTLPRLGCSPDVVH